MTGEHYDTIVVGGGVMGCTDAVGVGAVALTLFGPALAGNDDTDYLTSQAAIADVVEEVVADGTVAAATTYSLAFGADPQVATDSSSAGAAGGWLVELVDVAVGDQVAAGDVLAVASDDDAQAELELVRANLEAAEARYDADLAGTSATDQQAAQLAVDQAEQNLAAAQQSRDETVEQNRIRIEQAEDEVSRARDQLSEDRADDAPNAVIEQDRDALRAARDALTLLQAQVEADNRQANDQVDAAQLALDSAVNDYESRTDAVSAETLASDRAAVLQATREVADAEEQLAGATLRSPVDGVVVAVELVPGTLAPAADAVRVMTEAMQVTASFAEADLPSLRLGQTASVTVSATEDQLTGTVTQIDPVAATSAGDSVVSYAVTIDLGEVPDSVRSGMSAEVAVTVDRADDVIAIPSTALEGSGDTYAVRLLNADGSVAVRQVEVGLVTDSLAEIVAGIAVGEQVIVGTTSSLNTTTNNPFGPGGGGGFQQGGGPPRVITTP